MPAFTTIASEVQIQRAYENEAVAKSYIDVRFKSELNRLLHGRQVDAVQRAIDQARPERILEIAPDPGGSRGTSDRMANLSAWSLTTL